MNLFVIIIRKHIKQNKNFEYNNNKSVLLKVFTNILLFNLIIK